MSTEMLSSGSLWPVSASSMSGNHEHRSSYRSQARISLLLCTGSRRVAGPLLP